MKFLFDDESFSFETLRAAGFANDGGSDLGEVLATARNIGEGDEDAWLREWKATAQRVHAIGSRALAAGHRVSAREALLRASNYYRTAEFLPPRRSRQRPRGQASVHPLPRDLRPSRRPHGHPRRGRAHPLPGHQPARLPLPRRRLRHPRPTVIFTSGFDSTLEEVYFVIAAAALRRGYNVLAYDGPGQGAALREQALVFRPDWEAVVTPVVDYALTRPEIAADRIVLMGYSLGGYLTARAAAHEHRLAALVLDDGLYSYHDANTQIMPPSCASGSRPGATTSPTPWPACS